ncbi:MAG: DUF2905 domain-containing protein [Deltaproteobacteria bacterium]|nr:DUF2905 domain-containing protein [Deltaproteobacteria bacterium]
MDFPTIGKMVAFVGLAVVALGLLLWLGGKLGLPFGSLPSDIRVDRPGFSFRFPLMTCIVLSVILSVLGSVLFWIFRK